MGKVSTPTTYIILKTIGMVHNQYDTLKFLALAKRRFRVPNVGKYGFIGSFVLYLAACSGEKYAKKL